MTRETKIGLLVGLAFIIVIGILLSDHLTQTNEPQQAQLAQVAGNVRTGVAVPGASATTPPPQAVAPQTSAVTPHSPVPTQEDLTPTRPPVEVIQVGGDAGKTGAAKAQATAPQTQERGVTGIDSNSTVVARPIEPVSGSLSTVAKSFGEDVVPANGGSSSHSDPTSGGTTPPKPTNTSTAVPTAGMKQYTAVAGDSLYKIAAKTMGSGGKANRDALIAANPSLQQNPNLVIAGTAYNIPASASASKTSSSTSTSTPGQTSSAPAPTPSKIAIVADKPPTASEPTGNVYTVKAGDSLTKIAVEQCGTAGAVNAIIDLNKDVLKGGTTIRPNMKLHLPNKPVATAD